MRLHSQIFLLIITIFIPYFAHASNKPTETDVIVVVDTSVSMKEKGMDPERASLLVSKLLSDVLPGKVSFIRLLDLKTDAHLLPSKTTGEKIACREDPSKKCNKVEQDGDWKQMAHDKLYGVVERPTRGDDVFKQQLDSHLEQRANNSIFYLSFSAAQGVFDKHNNDETEKYIIWLSDGRVNSPPVVKQLIQKMQSDSIHFDAIVFGRGDASLAKETNIPVIQSHGPADLMRAFADAFRKILRAPYSIDNKVSEASTFNMLPEIKEAWVVVYGDDSLAEVSIKSPKGEIAKESYASDKLTGAGAYKVVYVKEPSSGDWEVIAENGGGDVAYAVVQNSSLYPFLESPEKATLHNETLVVTSIKSSLKDNVINIPELLNNTHVTAHLNGQDYPLNDEGKEGDETANDGLYSGKVVFKTEGENSIDLHLTNDQVNKVRNYKVIASGYYRYMGSKAIDLDFGMLANNEQVCKQIALQAEQKGLASLKTILTQELPPEHKLEVSNFQNPATNNNEFVTINSGDKLNICLITGENAPSSNMQKQPLLQLQLPGNTGTQNISFNISWDVKGLSFLQRWLWLILLVLAIIAAIIIVLGFILPKRFPSSLHIALGDEIEDLNEYTPMQIKQWKGTGIGFYRNARAFVHDNFRVSGKARGASVKITSEKIGIALTSINGASIFRKNFQQEWELESEEFILRAGEVLRIGELGPYFKLVHK